LANVTRIAFVGPDYPDSLESNLGRAAQRLGLNADVLPYLAGQGGRRARFRRVASRFDRFEQLAQQRFIANHGAEYDLTIVLTGAATVFEPKTIEQIRKRSRKVVAWYVDSPANLGSGRIFRSNYDALYFADSALVRTLRAFGTTPTYLLPEGHDIEWHRPRSNVPSSDHVAVVGNYYPMRVNLIERLMRAGIPLKLYGNPLPSYAHSLSHLHSGEWVSGAQKSRVFQGAAAVLNSLHPTTVDGANCRIFEATASGAVVVTEGRPLIRELFNDGEHLFVYDSFDALVSILHRVIADRAATQEMRQAAVDLAKGNSLDSRLEYLLNTIAS
jgi:spore maturation protein CgeB